VQSTYNHKSILRNREENNRRECDSRIEGRSLLRCSALYRLAHPQIVIRFFCTFNLYSARCVNFVACLLHSRRRRRYRSELTDVPKTSVFFLPLSPPSLFLSFFLCRDTFLDTWNPRASSQQRPRSVFARAGKSLGTDLTPILRVSVFSHFVALYISSSCCFSSIRFSVVSYFLHTSLCSLAVAPLINFSTKFIRSHHSPESSQPTTMNHERNRN